MTSLEITLKGRTLRAMLEETKRVEHSGASATATESEYIGASSQLITDPPPPVTTGPPSPVRAITNASLLGITSTISPDEQPSQLPRELQLHEQQGSDLIPQVPSFEPHRISKFNFNPLPTKSLEIH
jgi:hypothetical protein